MCRLARSSPGGFSHDLRAHPARRPRLGGRPRHRAAGDHYRRRRGRGRGQRGDARCAGGLHRRRQSRAPRPRGRPRIVGRRSSPPGWTAAAKTQAAPANRLDVFRKMPHAAVWNPPRSILPSRSRSGRRFLEVQRGGESDAVAQALEGICKKVSWYPLYSFARRAGHSPDDAQDLTQGFLSYVIHENVFRTASREFGRLRTFLLTAFRRYLSDIKDRDRAQKRGGNREILSLDAKIGEERYVGEVMDAVTPESLFERNWAVLVLKNAYGELAESEKNAGRGTQFSAFEAFVSPEAEVIESYQEVAARLEIREDAARQTVSRLRKKFREILRQQIADTLYNPTEEQIDEELRSLREALRS